MAWRQVYADCFFELLQRLACALASELFGNLEELGSALLRDDRFNHAYEASAKVDSAGLFPTHSDVGINGDDVAEAWSGRRRRGGRRGHDGCAVDFLLELIDGPATASRSPVGLLAPQGC